MKIGVVVLAGGRSVRFGSDKRRATMSNGQTILLSTINAIEHSGLPLHVCLGRTDTQLAMELQTANVSATQCQNSELGMGSTLAEGITARPHDWQGVIIALADMPWVTAATYSAIAAQLQPDNIVMPYHAGIKGNPVGFGSHYFDLLEGLQGDQGARNITHDYSGSVCKLAVDDPGIHCDIDTKNCMMASGK